MRPKRILYVQYTNPAAYPPLQNSSHLLANDGWEVQFLGTDVEGTLELRFPPHENISVRRMSPQTSGWRQKFHYLRYAVWVFRQALTWKPHWVYVSDPLAAPIGLLLKSLGCSVLYHEHDSPHPEASESGFMHVVFRGRSLLGQTADLCVLPNQDRADFFDDQVGREAVTHCVRNCPLRSEVIESLRSSSSDDRLYVHYHGSLAPSRLPQTVLDALTYLPESVHLRVIGYETVGHSSFVDDFRNHAADLGLADRVDFSSPMPRHELLGVTTRSHVGLSFMPASTDDINLKWMTGASNKPFDYLACGMPLLVSDLPDWESMFVDSGYARSCDPRKPRKIAQELKWYVDHPDQRRAMGERGRQRILKEWNYESEFSEVKAHLEG